MKLKTIFCKNGNRRIPIASMKNQYHQRKTLFVFDNWKSFSLYETDFDKASGGSKKYLWTCIVKNGKINVYTKNRNGQARNITNQNFPDIKASIMSGAAYDRLYGFMSEFFERYDIDFEPNPTLSIQNNIIRTKYPVLKELGKHYHVGSRCPAILNFDKHDSLESYWKHNKDGTISLDKIKKFYSIVPRNVNWYYTQQFVSLIDYLYLCKLTKGFLSQRKVFEIISDENTDHYQVSHDILTRELVKFWPKTKVDKLIKGSGPTICGMLQNIEAIKLLVKNGHKLSRQLVPEDFYYGNNPITKMLKKHGLRDEWETIMERKKR